MILMAKLVKFFPNPKFPLIFWIIIQKFHRFFGLGIFVIFAEMIFFVYL